MNLDLIHSLCISVALMLIIDGIIPFINPMTFRRTLLQMASMKDHQLRVIGLFSMMFGVVLLYWIN
ncbi:MAG: DUF2065 domain-containing protein [Piscirickettsiaceae bacterium]|nr:DUF2065 domain-containing protein [Piscirickettsiaceae bacterium]